jgi:beta-lactamase class A
MPEFLQHNLQRIVHGVKADWGIYVKFLDSGEEIPINADASMDTMSVIKIPLLVTLYREHDAGRVNLDERIVLQTRQKRFGTGVLKVLDNGLQLTLNDAATLMIILSDNSATDICYEAIGGPDAVNQTMQTLGLNAIDATGLAFDWFRALSASMDVTYATLSPEQLFTTGYPPLSAGEIAVARERFHFNVGREFSHASARAMGQLLEMIWRDECASAESCAEIRRILRLQQSRSRIPRYLFGATVAHKTGDFEPFIANDVGVIEPSIGSPIIVCFFASHHRGIWENLEGAIARMSEKVWEYGLNRSSQDNSAGSVAIGDKKTEN